jgi:pimeloyl-ACP methyl ester carboxylesterase
MPYFEHNNANIYYELHGAGMPVLLTAGMSSDSKSWQFILNSLSEHYRVILFDNRGCGRTSQNGSFTLKTIAADACALLDHLHIDKAHLIGHSMGGMIAQELAVAWPERIDKLVLASSSPVLSGNARAILHELSEKWEAGFDMDKWFAIMFRWLFTAKSLENKKFMDAAIIFALSYPYPQTLQGFKGQVEAISSFDLRSETGRIGHDTLIICGDEDILIPPHESRQLLGIKGKTTFAVIEGAAHSIHAEKPQEFAGRVMAFLAGKENCKHEEDNI